ncbi:nucleotide sugar dehydrogenase [Prochlorococcus sp. MIT 0604]|uniref:nucleotide sugar dehydrogenase n=1 Tax=Prochlorococcus sp. MIT 0604 TaxID=1501268 RepID=UPI0004F68B50|nr:nucleotide sugar dehydrogenase [Prochlorococcus sp. MIT 0604]AIQ95458.1 UDP-glucose dehydrogenase [Prochlorococcus sp. MIT 0604]
MQQIKNIKNICCIGAGFVGSPTMAVFAKYCPEIKITVLDINKEKIAAWNSKDSNDFPVFEKGLPELILQNRGKNLFFSIEIEKNIKNADMVFISVNTPTKTSGFGAGYASDLKYVESSARQVAKYSSGHTIVIEKSTVPVRTAELIKDILLSSQTKKENSNKTFSIISSPEFLAEGTAISDLENPDRVLIGGDEENSLNLLKNIYKRWIPENKILFTNLWSSELSKLTSNAFLAQRISSINSISSLCEATGAKITEVVNVIGSDKRIGDKFLSASPGFGGSCFQKDILNLVYLSEYYGLKEVANYWEQVLKLNNWQRKRISKIIIDKLFGTVSSKKITLLGFSFKPNTNDVRESSSIYIANYLLENGANLFIHDPKVSLIDIERAMTEFKSDNEFEGKWHFSNDLNDALESSNAVVVLTEWDQYLNLDWDNIFNLMSKPAWVFDTRSILDRNLLTSLGFKVWSVGVGD